MVGKGFVRSLAHPAATPSSPPNSMASGKNF
jgi:hypothetical protein